MDTIAIIDYGMGNIHSVARAIRAAAPQADVRLIGTPDELRRASRLVLPGQGAMRDCMRTLDASGLREALLEAARNKPLLGICVGEQMLFDHSEEGDTPALGLFRGEVRRFQGPAYASLDSAPAEATDATVRLKIPHMGWNRVFQPRAHALWDGIADGSHFYFVHSYYAVPADAQLTAGTSHYGQPFTCAVAADNIFAVQFHPEKSAALGLRLYRNFVDWKP